VTIVLHLLSQRPGRTGSGVTLDALARAAEGRFDQAVSIGVPLDDPAPVVGGLAAGRVHPLVFGEAPLAFRLPGMSDVMPYPSTVFSSMSPAQLTAYRDGWRAHLEALLDRYRPQLIHTHHAWLMSATLLSLLEERGDKTPVVLHSHATGLRQMTLCPHLKDEVVAACRHADAFLALHDDHRRQLATLLDIDEARIEVVGAGYNEHVFAPGEGAERERAVVFAGKLAAAKGLPWLLDAMASLNAGGAGVHLHVAGDGSGEEADTLKARMARMDNVTWHGPLPQPQLADLLAHAQAFVLPSLYEGLPLVLVEAAAMGCRLVVTELEAIAGLRGPLAPALHTIAMPALDGPDAPLPPAVPAFVSGIEAAVLAAVDEQAPPRLDLSSFTWAAVAERVQAVWRRLLAAPSDDVS
jgi:glycosyltransferase involved in cell wall biosynthesis